MRIATNSVQQRYKMGTVLVGDSGEFQTQSAARNQVPHFSLDPDVSLLDEKIKVGFDTQGLRNWCGEEQPAHT
jgi:hypothetical protein